MSEKLPIMTLRLFQTPMMPAMAIPPMPMLLAYWKICCGIASPARIPAPTSRSGQMKAIAGTTIHQMSTEPAHMMVAYFRPTIYPIPSRAAEVLQLRKNLPLAAIVVPSEQKVLVKFSAHVPKVATRKS